VIAIREQRIKRMQAEDLMFLSSQEIIDLTGSKRKATQCEWLAAHGYTFDRRLNGTPVVLKDEAYRILLGGEPPSTDEPDWTSMDVAA